MSGLGNLICPIRGPLAASHFAKDGLTVTEEARRIDCISYLLKRKYPKNNIECETTLIKQIGNAGRNSLRADIVVYDISKNEAFDLSDDERNGHIVLIAEIKRESKAKTSALSFQLEPALRQIDKTAAYGIYWDDINRILFCKKLERGTITITRDDLGNLPIFGNEYKYKKLKYEDLLQPEDITATLLDIANILRSHGINDESIRYKETVKLLLAKYIDERESKEKKSVLKLQVIPGFDSDFNERVHALYRKTARIYSKAKSIFSIEIPDIPELALKAIIQKIQGLNLYDSSSDSMQQVFMTFVPSVFKKDLDQYFTPLTLVNCMVQVLSPGPNDKIGDPAMGTADFLTAAMQYRLKKADNQIVNRVYGADKDPQAYELAVINMILNKDGQTNLENCDTIEKHTLWKEQMDIVLCNPPFGSRTIETRKHVLEKYDLAHVWVFDEKMNTWSMTNTIQEAQQLGILFIERCYKMLVDGGKMAIILPEGYLCTQSYGYIRQWLLNKFEIIGLVELPRRIFLKSEADLRSNILFAKKTKKPRRDYPVHTELVRKVGYKLGKGFFTIPVRDSETGLEVRDQLNKVIIDTDFSRVEQNFLKFLPHFENSNYKSWRGAMVSDIKAHPFLDMKPRRLTYKALENIRNIKKTKYLRLADVAEVIETTVSFNETLKSNELMYLIEGQDIRAVEGIVVLKDKEKRWQVEIRKSEKGYAVQKNDIVIGLVRPERRNIGLFIYNDKSVYASPDGVAVVRQKSGYEEKYPIQWVFHALRTEQSRIQFWTESGGTSYGKLSIPQIKDVLISIPKQPVIDNISKKVKDWSTSILNAQTHFKLIWDSVHMKTILNSPIIGLEGDDIPMDDIENENQ